MDPLLAQAERVMVIMAHPDDAEIQCGGTVARLVRAGKKVIYVLCTSGDRGTAEAGLTAGRLAAIREAEQVWVGHIVLKSEKAPMHPEDFTSVDDLARAWRPVRQQTVQFLQKATREQLAEVIVDEYDSYVTYRVELALWHFVTHEFYHAGEICLHLGLSGLQPFVPEIIR